MEGDISESQGKLGSVVFTHLPTLVGRHFVDTSPSQGSRFLAVAKMESGTSWENSISQMWEEQLKSCEWCLTLSPLSLS